MSTKVIAKLVPAELSVLLDQIGNTPLQPVSLVMKEKVHTIYLKLEGANPGGSIKIRTAHALIQDLENRGLIGKDTTIVESTSGNLGVALSMIAKAKGYQFLAVVDPKT